MKKEVVRKAAAIYLFIYFKVAMFVALDTLNKLERERVNVY